MGTLVHRHILGRRRCITANLMVAASVLLLAWKDRAFLFAGNGGGCGAGIGSLRGQPAPRAALAQREAGPTGSSSGAFSLRYFDGRGAAETSRILFVLAGEDYEDKRYAFTFGVPGDFSTIQREEFEADKAAGKMDIAMGKVPVLEAGPDFALPQSKAIERYLARRFGMMGSTLEEEAWVDAIAEHVRDINDAYSRKGLFFMKDAEKKAEIQKKWFEEELPEFLKKLEAALPAGSEGFAVGDKVSLADVVIWKLLKDNYGDEDVSSAYEGCPKLCSIVAMLDGTEALQQWLTKRPVTMF
jgi:glutathione S-transferase